MKIQHAISFIISVVIVLCFLLPYQGRAKDLQSSLQRSSPVDNKVIAGKWLRPDGGYKLELSEVRSEGRLKAVYYNPRPIHVSKAEWRLVDGQLRVFIELHAPNYPGSTYTLVYMPERDSLAGYYYQAALQQTFDVMFVREK